MDPAKWNTKIQRGMSFKPTMLIKSSGAAVDLTDCHVRAHGNIGDWDGTELFDWSDEDEVPYITVGTTDGLVTFAVPGDATALFGHCKGVWAVEFTWADDSQDRLTEGTFQTSEAH